MKPHIGITEKKLKGSATILASALSNEMTLYVKTRKSHWNVTGESFKSSLCIGTLMNARGLMELILLNIGLDRGIITPNLFTVLAIMAIVTTLMTTPIFNAIFKRMPKDEVKFN